MREGCEYMKISEYVEKLSGSGSDNPPEIFGLLYPGGPREAAERYRDLGKHFIELYGDREGFFFSAPGRTEIGGNHTDHQHGCVLASSIDLDAVAVAAVSDDGLVHIVSLGFGDEITIDPDHITRNPHNFGTTESLVCGVLAGSSRAGFRTGGFCACITSSVPGGAGLSSSAAFETLLTAIISVLFNEGAITPVENARISQYAENVYFGKPCGLMDQMACAAGGLIYVDFRDPENPELTGLPFHPENHGYSLVVTDTGGSHADLTADYAAVPEEMCRAAEFFGAEYLRDVNPEDIISGLPALRKSLGDRCVLRALHFINEEKRVARQRTILENLESDSDQGFEDFLDEFRGSAASSELCLQNIYSPSHPESQGITLGLAVSRQVLSGTGSAVRVHGGGFAGTIQAFVRRGQDRENLKSYMSAMDSLFGQGSAHLLHIRPLGAVKIEF